MAERDATDGSVRGDRPRLAGICSRRLSLAAAAGLALLTFALGWRAAVQPLLADEVEFVQTGPALWRGEGPIACAGEGWEAIVHHPQAYHLLLGGLAALAGGELNPWLARLPGIVSMLLTLPLAFLLARRVSPRDEPGRGWVAAAVLATSPLALQGALLVDIDTGLLPAPLLGFLCLLCRRADAPQRRRAGLPVLGLAFCGLLWVKLPTPFLATAAMGLTGLSAPRRRWMLGEAAAISAIGVLLFAGSWTAFCRVEGLDPWAPLAHLAGRGAAHVTLSPAVVAKRALRLLLWLGPWLSIAAVRGALALRGDERQETATRSLVGHFAWAVGLGYLVVGGEAYGFPRYHVPLVPALAALAAGTWSARRSGLALLLGSGALVHGLLLVGDPLLAAYTRAESVAAGDIPAGAATGAVLATGALWVLPALLLPLFLRVGMAPGACLVALAIGSGLGTTAVQVRAPYRTNYIYGERGAREAAERLGRWARRAELVVVPKDLAFRVLPCGTYRFSSRSLGPGELLRRLQGAGGSLVVLRRGDLADPGSQTTLRDPRLRRVLSTDMECDRVGDFFFYSRRRAP